MCGSLSAGWSLAMDAWGGERRTGFIDAAQLGFLQNLAALRGLRDSPSR